MVSKAILAQSYPCPGFATSRSAALFERDDLQSYIDLPLKNVFRVCYQVRNIIQTRLINKTILAQSWKTCLQGLLPGLQHVIIQTRWSPKLYWPQLEKHSVFATRGGFNHASAQFSAWSIKLLRPVISESNSSNKPSPSKKLSLKNYVHSRSGKPFILMVAILEFWETLGSTRVRRD